MERILPSSTVLVVPALIVRVMRPRFTTHSPPTIAAAVRTPPRRARPRPP
jgi:hypothetical protein